MASLSMTAQRPALAAYLAAAVQGATPTMIGLGVDAGCLVRDQHTLAIASGGGNTAAAAAAAARAASAMPAPVEVFLPKRMAYEFDMDSDRVDSLPTTVVRAKDDCPSAEVRTCISEGILDDDEHVMILGRVLVVDGGNVA